MSDIQEEFFRQLKPPLDTTYLTHNFHPYAAKFIPQIPAFFINKYTSENDIILDPFCGSGTSLVEAKLLNRSGIGVDINELSVLISKVKTTKINVEELQLVDKLIQTARSEIAKNYSKIDNSTNLDYYHNNHTIYNSLTYILPKFTNIDHWFQTDTIYELSIIKNLIDNSDFSSNLKNFLFLAFSSIIVISSNQESETRYSAQQKNHPKFFVINQFESKVLSMKQRMLEFNKKASDSVISVFCHDSRDLEVILKPKTIDLAVTSPPYPNTYDYYLYHKQRMNWLNLDWWKAKNNEIGSRLRYSSYKEDVSSYIADMSRTFLGVSEAIKPNGRFIIVIGDSYLKGRKYSGDELIKLASEGSGFIVEESFSYDLAISSKVFNKAFRKDGKKEHIMIFKKS
jgi:site-specific DNA-methyltransferase (cytosine-N4-specific)